MNSLLQNGDDDRQGLNILFMLDDFVDSVSSSAMSSRIIQGA